MSFIHLFYSLGLIPARQHRTKRCQTAFFADFTRSMRWVHDITHLGEERFRCAGNTKHTETLRDLIIF